MRAKTSCEIIRDINGDNDKPIIIHQDLIEREFGEADGLTITDEVYDNILKNNYQGMESSSAINIRSTTELSNLVSLNLSSSLVSLLYGMLLVLEMFS